MSFNWFILTIPHAEFTPYLPKSITYIRGQLELAESGFLHWQFVVCSAKKVRVTAIKKIFGDRAHIEPTRSAAAIDYVWKDCTRVEGTQFELGSKPINRSIDKDWEVIRSAAKDGLMDSIPPDVYVRCYSQLKRIGVDHCRPIAIEREVFVFWGVTGSGKSRRAWEEGGLDSFPKDPNSKFWDGYRGQEHVIIDEFRGTIGISHMLRWLDRYPVLVEIKGSSTVLKAKKIWITSNLDPRQWYPELDTSTRDALLRRLTITYFPFANS